MFYDRHITVYLNRLVFAEHVSHTLISVIFLAILHKILVFLQVNIVCKQIATFRSVQVRIAYVLLCGSRAAYRQGAHIITLSLLGSRRRVMSLDMLAIRDEFWHA